MLTRLLPAIALLLLATAARAADDALPDAAGFEQKVRPLLSKYCNHCHGGTEKVGGLAFDRFQTVASLVEKRSLWQKMGRNLNARIMPPEGELLPTAAEIEFLVGWIERETNKVDCGLRDPGRVTIRRLNRAEYNNTIRDLLGIEFRPADDFPADDVGYGYDNIGDVLSLPPLLMEKYLAAAEQIVEKADLKRLITCQPQDDNWRPCAEEILRSFGGRALRRPLRDEELARLVKLVQMAQGEGDSFDGGIQLAVQAVLVSPHFLFRIELDREPNNPQAIYPINDYELATRLSYFLWSTMPDEQLFDLAAQGELHKPEVLEKQVRRMLAHPRSFALVENFADQWLQIRNLRSVSPSQRQFRNFNEKLRMAMWKETQLFFQAILREDRSVLELLDADFTFLNEPLARHYGITDVTGNEFQRVTLDTDQRGGVLTQASVLTITSNPTRTSPVKRGKWILEQLLGASPPSPPPGVEELPSSREARASGTLRQRMEIHRQKASCAACHRSMDPLGFGLENYDAVGGWRTTEGFGRFPIDSSGELPDGRTFNGPKELKAILLARSPEFVRTLSENLLTFALGRGLEYYDKCAVDEIAAEVTRQEHRFSALVLAVVRSDPFLKRRGKGADQ